MKIFIYLLLFLASFNLFGQEIVDNLTVQQKLFFGDGTVQTTAFKGVSFALNETNLQFQGEWDAAKIYYRNDYVSYEGNLFFIYTNIVQLGSSPTIDDTGVGINNAFWDVLIKRGEQGDTSGGATQYVVRAISSSSNYISWVSNSINNLISYWNFSLTNFVDLGQTQQVFRYVNSPTNFISWKSNSSNGRISYWEGTLTNSLFGGSGGSTTINITNLVGNTSITNIFFVTNNLEAIIVTNLNQNFISAANNYNYNIQTNNVSITNIIGNSTFITTNIFETKISNTFETTFNTTNIFSITNNLSFTNSVGAVTVVNTNFFDITNLFNISIVQTNFNTINATSTIYNTNTFILTNLFQITQNITNENTVTASAQVTFTNTTFAFTNTTEIIITNIVPVTNFVYVTNFVNVTNHSYITNNIGITNNISNSVTIGSTTVVNTNFFSNTFVTGSTVINVTNIIDQSSTINYTGGNLFATNTPTIGQMLYASEDGNNSNLYWAAAPEGGGGTGGGSPVQYTSIVNFAQSEQQSVTGIVIGVYDDGAATQQIVRATFQDPFSVNRVNAIDPDSPLNFIVSTNPFVGNFDNGIDSNLQGSYMTVQGSYSDYAIFSISGDGSAAESVVLTKPLSANTTNLVTGFYTIDSAINGVKTAFASDDENDYQFQSGYISTYGVISLNSDANDQSYLLSSTILNLSAADPQIINATDDDNIISYRSRGSWHSSAYVARYAMSSNRLYATRGDNNDRYIRSIEIPAGATGEELYDYLRTNVFTTGSSEYDVIGILAQYAQSFDVSYDNQTMIYGGQNYVYYSTNGGSVFNQLTAIGNFDWQGGSAISSNKQVVYIAAYNAASFGVVRTTNNFATYDKYDVDNLAGFAGSDDYYDMDMDDEGWVVITTVNSILYRTFDDGSTTNLNWEAFTLPGASYIRSVRYHNGVWTASNGNDIYVSTNAFQSIERRIQGVVNYQDTDVRTIRYSQKYDSIYILSENTLFKFNPKTWKTETLINFPSTFARNLSIGGVNDSHIFTQYYVGSYNQYSTDGGLLWQYVRDPRYESPGLSLYPIYSFNNTANGIFAGTNKLYLLTTVNYPRSYNVPIQMMLEGDISELPTVDWKMRGLPNYRSGANAVIGEPAIRDGIIYVGIQNGTVLVSEDLGETWRILLKGLYAGVSQNTQYLLDTAGVSAGPNMVYQTRAYQRTAVNTATRHQYKRSRFYTNKEDEIELYSGSSKSVSYLHTIDDTNLWIATVGGAIQKSTDGGVTVANTGSGNQNWSAVCTVDNTNLLATVYGGLVYQSSNAGVNWSEYSILNGGGNKYWVSIDMPTTNFWVLTQSDGNIVYTEDGGQNWIEYFLGGSWTYNGNYVSGIRIDPLNTNLAVMSTRNLVYLSTNGVLGTFNQIDTYGNGMDPKGSYHETVTLKVSPLDDNVIISVAGELGEGEIYKSIDGGKTFDLIVDTGNRLFDVETADGVTWITSGYQHRPLISNDRGETWTVSEINRGNEVVFTAPIELPYQPNTRYFIPYNDSIVKVAPENYSFYTNYGFVYSSPIGVTGWDDIVDTLADYDGYQDNNLFFAFGFNSTSTWKVYKNGQWKTIVTNNPSTGNWRYYNNTFNTSFTASPNTLDAALKSAFTYETNKMSYTEITGLTATQWDQSGYTNGANVNVLIGAKRFDNFSIFRNFDFVANFTQGIVTREKAEDYDISITTNGVSTITRKPSGVVNATIYYMEIP